MIDELLGVNDRTVVVLKDSSPVLMPWIDRAPAVLEVWNQGTEDGHVRSAVWQRHPVGQSADHLPGLRATRSTTATRSATRAPTGAAATR
jgi:hypothetical protein